MHNYKKSDKKKNIFPRENVGLRALKCGTILKRESFIAS